MRLKSKGDTLYGKERKIKNKASSGLNLGIPDVKKQEKNTKPKKIEKLTGGQLTKQVNEYLVKSGWLAIRFNTDARGKHKNYTIANNGKSEGFNDILAMKGNQCLLLEIKGYGDRQRKSQKEFEKLCDLTKNDYYIVESLYDVPKIINARGL